MTSPIIAVTSDYKQGEYFLLDEYADAIMTAGGVPVFLPYTVDPALINAFLDHVDGLLLTGGSDINPTLYGRSLLRTLEKLRLSGMPLK